MSWLKTIYESVVNEIGADDAYNRFYSSIPREDYDAILNGDPAPDKFMQFALNCVRDGKATKDEAIETIQKYKNADELVRQNVLNKFRNGEYEDLVAISADIDYLSSGGAVLSRKKFAKEGFFKIKETDKWVLTCVTNYTASNHYFGDSHWCTASDRDGEYDGYSMFLNYTDLPYYKHYLGNVLFQLKWKGEILGGNSEEDENYDYVDSEAFDGNKGYIGEKIGRKYSMFQAQVDVENARVGQICDFFDKDVTEGKLERFVGSEMMGAMKDNEIRSWCWKKMVSQYEKEEKYQESQEKIVRKRRQRREEALRRLWDELRTQCNQWNSEKKEKIKALWYEFIDKKLYQDSSILMKMVERDLNGIDNETDEALAETYFAAISDVYNNGNGMLVFLIKPMVGIKKSVDDTRDGEDVPPYIYDSYTLEYIHDLGFVTLLLSGDRGEVNSLEEVIGVAKEGNDVSISTILDKSSDAWSSKERFYICQFINYGTSQVKNVLVDTMWNGDDYQIFDCPFDTKSFMQINDETIIFYSGNSDREFFYYSPNTGEIKSSDKDEHLIILDAYGYSISICSNGINKIYNPSKGLYGQVIKEKSAIGSIRYSLESNGRLRLGNRGVKLNDGDILGYQFEYKNGANAIIVGSDGEPIFGIYGTRVGGAHKNRIAISIDRDKVQTSAYADKDGDRTIFYYDTEEGFFYVDSQGNHIKADRFGKTEEDKIADKNFRDWQAQGGHSPEAQAQMDAMWNERQGVGKGAQSTFDAWNDDDLNLDDAGGDGKFRYMPDFEFNKALQNFDKDDRWRGTVMLKDPEGYAKSMSQALDDPDYGINNLAHGKIPDYIRRNPWYRIGRDGKPIDQPWYDEDEIPARLSDRIVRENRINSQFNKMKSIWDRMGLNEDL